MPAKSAASVEPTTQSSSTREESSREELIAALNQDLAREYQAIIAYVVYSQTLKGPEYMDIARELEKHAHEELEHALIIAKQIDYLGGSPTVTPKAVRQFTAARDMLQEDLRNENETVRQYRDRVRQSERLGEYALSEHIREILVQEQEHQIDLATALGQDVPDTSRTFIPPPHQEGDSHHGSPEEERKTPL